MNSAIYTGTIRHRRFAPTPNTFQYRLFMVLADLDELPRIFEGHPWWSLERPNVVTFRRQDYMGPADLPLDTVVRDLVGRRTGLRPQGPVRMLAHFRTWGYCFNPVCFYYCYATDGRTLQAIVANIHNTPWGERHGYVLDARNSITTSTRWQRYRLHKSFHISPFMEMNLSYDWRFRVPGQQTGAHLRVLDGGRELFDATLRLQRQPLDRSAMTRVLYQYPLMTHKVTSMIYWQALRLWHKKTPFHAHPAKGSST